MPLPAIIATPVALRLLTVGAAFAAGALVAARRGPERVDIVTEDTLDRLRDGADLRVDPRAGRADAEARWTRTVRLGATGPGVSVDVAGLARILVRRAR